MLLPGITMDSDERGTTGVNVNRLVIDTPCQDTADNLGKSPIDWT